MKEVVTDEYGQAVTAADPSTINGWNAALADIFDFRGDPGATLADLAAADGDFVMGLVVMTAGAVLGGDDPSGVEVTDSLTEATRRSAGATLRERMHVDALVDLVGGNFTEAAAKWDAVATGHPHDIVATRLAHDIYLHVGDDARRLKASESAFAGWQPGEPGYGWTAGQLAFALEESGHYDEAERHGRLALEVDPVDVWALHALAHVFEMQERHEEAVEHLRSTRAGWEERDHLALHLLWHLLIRLVAVREFDECLAEFDSQVGEVERAFGLTDLTSLLWRLELAGCDVGDRWPTITEKWRNHDQLHTTGFLDLHAAMAFARCPADPGAGAFWEGLDACHRGVSSENDETFDLVVRPIAAAISNYREGHFGEAADAFRELKPVTYRVGGSIAQRDIFVRTGLEALRRFR
ncbi:MAG: tetratricopeptide repeat protein [Acidimicrobiia bacterium]|nr:tetratricopeptide repeat protein [Actinomycetota bacterium]MBL6924591.1 tetratricopeptide repeat protein [Acidimicrobiia bacterium]